MEKDEKVKIVVFANLRYYSRKDDCIIYLKVNRVLKMESNPLFEFLTILCVLTLAIVIVIILDYYSKKRDALKVVKEKPKKLMTLTTELTPNEVLTTIIDDVSPTFGYKVEVINEEKKQVILSTPTTLSTWGFFYPIYITSQTDGMSFVEIGIKSKLFQGGPIGGRIRTKYHRRCFNAIKNKIARNKE